MPADRPLAHAQLLQLKRWNTPTIYNGWEQVTRHDTVRECVNHEETRDFMPEMGPMVGYAITLVISAAAPGPRKANPDAFMQYLTFVASQPGPKIVVVQDLDKPEVLGSLWGEVCSNTHRALGCVGTITDGAIRDFDEMRNAGFKAIARRFCVGHAHVWPQRWNVPVEVFGTTVRPGDLIHADKHGFLVIPPEDQERLLDAVTFMDGNECRTVIPAARGAAGLSSEQVLANLAQSQRDFGANVRAHFRRQGEW